MLSQQNAQIIDFYIIQNKQAIKFLTAETEQKK